MKVVVGGNQGRSERIERRRSSQGREGGKETSPASSPPTISSLSLLANSKQMKLVSSLVAAVALLASSSTQVQASSSTGPRVLVALEKQLNRDDYSHFWKSLEGQHNLRSLNQTARSVDQARMSLI